VRPPRRRGRRAGRLGRHERGELVEANEARGVERLLLAVVVGARRERLEPVAQQLQQGKGVYGGAGVSLGCPEVPGL